MVARHVLSLPRLTRRQLYTSTRSLLGKTCFITGGSRGIGHAIASRFATEGASCVVVSRKLASAQQAIARLDSSSGQVHSAVELDVAVARWPWTSDDLNGVQPQSIDIVVNAAGVAQNKLLCFMTSDEIEDLVSTNLMGTIYSCRSFSKPMLRRKAGGCIINISSVLAARAAKGSSIYAACKAGVEELGPRNVRVNAIRPGLIQTAMLSDSVSSEAERLFLDRIPCSRTGTADEIADAALFLVQNKYCNGTILTVDGGFSTSL